MLDALNPRRIVLIKPSALGDIVQALPVLAILRQRFPKAHISWVVNRGYVSLLEGHPHLNDIIPFDRSVWNRGWYHGLTATLRFCRQVRQRHFDLAIDLQGLLRSGIITGATGAPVRIGLSSSREGAAWFYTQVLKDHRETEHAVDRYWRVAEALGMGAEPKRFILPVNEKAEDATHDLLKGLPRPWIAVSVGSRWLTKRWPPSHFHDLLRRAALSSGGSAIFVGSPDEATLADLTAANLPMGVRNLAGKTTLPQLTSILRQCDAMISNDSGPLHLAVALGVPIVAPYTCTKVKRNGPFGQEAHAVETTVSCAGSYVRRCDTLHCMDELTPHRLWPVLEGILSQWQRNRLSA